jgi:hypothetical protein
VFAPSEEEAEQFNTPAPDQPKPTQKKTTPTSDAPPPADPNATPAQLLAESEGAAKKSQWALALRRAEDAMEHPQSAASGNNARAAMVAALAACNLKIRAKAKTYYARAIPASKVLIEQRCLANGVDPVDRPAGSAVPAPKTNGDGVMNPFAPR